MDVEQAIPPWTTGVAPALIAIVGLLIGLLMTSTTSKHSRAIRLTRAALIGFAFVLAGVEIGDLTLEHRASQQTENQLFKQSQAQTKLLEQLIREVKSRDSRRAPRP